MYRISTTSSAMTLGLCMMFGAFSTYANELPPIGKYTSVAITPEKNTNAGPTGIGWIKLGTKEEDIKIAENINGFEITNPLIIPSNIPSNLSAGDKFLHSLTKTPFSKQALNSYFTFRSGRLIVFNMQLGSGPEGAKLFADIKKSIYEKYGDPLKKSESIADKDCIYRNGSTIKMPDGTNSYSWYHATNEKHYIETAIYDRAYARCADNLIKDDFSQFRNYSIVIRYVINDSSTTSNIKSAF